VDGLLDAAASQVGARLLMRSTDESKASFKEVRLHSAKVENSVEMRGATFDGDLIAPAMKVGAHF
jgi:hypothetical protein